MPKLMPGGGPPGPGSTTHPSAQWFAHMLKVAQCTFPGGGGVISGIDGAILLFLATIDTQSPLITRAAAACGFPLHNH